MHACREAESKKSPEASSENLSQTSVPSKEALKDPLGNSGMHGHAYKIYQRPLIGLKLD